MILVTGGGGFIGRSVVRLLTEQGREVIALDTSPDESWLEGLKGARLVVGSFLDWDLLNRTVQREKVDAIIHLAYLRDIALQEEEPLAATRVNATGFCALLEVARITGIRRVVWASSVATLGLAGEYGGQVVNEDAPTHPHSIYGACKVHNEYMGEHYTRKFGVMTLGLRLPIVYGPGRYYRGLNTIAYDFFAKPGADGQIVVPTGDQEAEWLYVKDAAQAFAKAVAAPAPLHCTFNICGTVATARAAAEILGRLRPDVDIRVRPGLNPRGQPVRRDGTRAHVELGYEPEYDLATGFADYLRTLAS